MLRSGKKISIAYDTITSNHGVMLAPIINLNGIILRADNPIPVEIKTFLEEHQVKVNRIRYNGELLVRLMGKYNLSKAITDQFIQEHPALIASQTENLDTLPPAVNLQAEIAKSIDETLAGKPLELYVNGIRFSAGGGVIAVGSDSDITAGSSKNSGRIAVGKNMTTTSREHIHQGVRSDTVKIGFFAEARAKKKSFFNGPMHAENALIDSGEDLSLEGTQGTLNLTLEREVFWGNNPHQELLVLKPKV